MSSGPHLEGITLEICKRSGTDSASCGDTACEYGCDLDYIECVPVETATQAIAAAEARALAAEKNRDEWKESKRRQEITTAEVLEDATQLRTALEEIARRGVGRNELGKIARAALTTPTVDEGERDDIEGLPPDLARVVRDPSVIVPQDQSVFNLIAEWQNAPSNTASADPYEPRCICEAQKRRNPTCPLHGEGSESR